MDTVSPLHIVIFPFMAQGHTLPLLDISKAFASRGLKVTIITTPSNAPFILSKISSCQHKISLSIIPFPKVSELPQGCENTANLPSMDLFLPFIRATKLLRQPFEDNLRKMIEIDNIRPACVISDFFLGWTLDSCRLFGVPRIVSHGMGALPMTILKTFSSQVSNTVNLSNYDIVSLPNLSIPFPIVKADFPESVRRSASNDPFLDFMLSEIEPADVNSWGVIVNSFEELEGEHIASLESLYMNGAKAWLVGPLLLHGLDSRSHFKSTQSCSCIQWLDQQVELGLDGAVVYVSFGTQAHLSDNQMEEIAMGLEMAGKPFIWVIKSRTWVPPVGWEERVKDRGLVQRDWVEQRSILEHPAVGGFLSHCGWNSVLESLCMGVPILGLPMGAEQALNSKYVAEGLKVGIAMPLEFDDEDNVKVVPCNVICDGVRDLMMQEKGRKAREMAKELGKLARQVVDKGGSSHKNLDELIKCLSSKVK